MVSRPPAGAPAPDASHQRSATGFPEFVKLPLVGLGGAVAPQLTKPRPGGALRRGFVSPAARCPGGSLARRRNAGRLSVLACRLVEKLEREFERLEQRPELKRLFRDFRYRTLDNWSPGRVVGKAEYTGDKENPRFFVTSLRKKDVEARELYEKVYCARGDTENRIKEQQLAMFADRTSAHTMRANHLGLERAHHTCTPLAPRVIAPEFLFHLLMCHFASPSSFDAGDDFLA